MSKKYANDLIYGKKVSYAYDDNGSVYTSFGRVYFNNDKVIVLLNPKYPYSFSKVEFNFSEPQYLVGNNLVDKEDGYKVKISNTGGSDMEFPHRFANIDVTKNSVKLVHDEKVSDLPDLKLLINHINMIRLDKVEMMFKCSDIEDYSLKEQLNRAIDEAEIYIEAIADRQKDAKKAERFSSLKKLFGIKRETEKSSVEVSDTASKEEILSKDDKISEKLVDKDDKNIDRDF